MAPKRKREEEKDVDSVFRPPAGTRSYETGQSVKEGLASGSRQGKYLSITDGIEIDRQLSWLSTSRSIRIGPNFLSLFRILPSRSYNIILMYRLIARRF